MSRPRPLFTFLTVLLHPPVEEEIYLQHNGHPETPSVIVIAANRNNNNNNNHIDDGNHNGTFAIPLMSRGCVPDVVRTPKMGVTPSCRVATCKMPVI